MIRSSWNGPDVGIFAYTYELTRSSFAGTFPASQCHVSHAEPVSGGSWAAQSASEIGSLFLFDPPAPEYVVLSVPPFCDVSSLRKAAAAPPNVPVAEPLSLPEASNRSAQSGPLAVFPSPRMFAAWTPPSSNRLSSWTACAPATMKIAARTTINTGASRNRRRRRLPVGPRTRVAIRSYLLRVGCWAADVRSAGRALRRRSVSPPPWTVEFRAFPQDDRNRPQPKVGRRGRLEKRVFLVFSTAEIAAG